MAREHATFILVHGAWHGGWCYGRVVRLLRGRGHEVHAPTLAGLGEHAHLYSPAINASTVITHRGAGRRRDGSDPAAARSALALGGAA